MFKLDYSKAQTLQISNDAFYWLLYEEEPLDEDNIEEAKEVADMFPNGFQIEDNWSPLPDEGLIEATFVPYIEEETNYDLVHELTKYIELHLTWLDEGHSQARVLWHDLRNNSDELYGDVLIQQTPKGLKYFERGTLGNGNYSRFYLKHFHEPQ